jgi:hypothetical protein
MESEEARVQRILTTILADSDRRIYSIIKENPSTKKDLIYRTKFPANLLDRILKELSSYNLVKSIKRPESKNMNVWVLYDHKEGEDQKEQLEEKDDLMNLIRKKDEIAITDLEKDAIRKGIKIDHFQQILTIMELSGEIYVINGVLMKRKPKMINSPCIECKQRDICAPGAVINPSNCPYLLTW